MKLPSTHFQTPAHNLDRNSQPEETQALTQALKGALVVKAYPRYY